MGAPGMRRPKFGSVLCAVAIATASAVPLFAAPAGAAVTNTCTTGGAGISQYPNDPGGQSSLRVSCTFTTATATSSTFWKVEESPEVVWHPGAGRTVVETSTTTNTVTSAAGHFSATADLNHPISGLGIPGRAFIISVSGTTATLNVSGVVAHAGATLIVENSDARSVADATFSGSTVTSPTAHFTAADIGKVITGTQIQHATTITAQTGGAATLSKPSTTCSAPALAADCKIVSLDPKTTLTTARQVDDATASGAVLTSAQAGFGATDVNLAVTGTGVPAGDFIKSVSGNTATLNVAPTLGTNKVVTIGQPNAAAPANGDQAAQLNAELALSPHLVQGQPNCALNSVQGFAESGKWENPGAFNGTALGSSTDASIKGPVVGQILYPTSVISFAAYVVKVKAAVSGESQTLAHYDVVFPLLPTSIAACPSPSTAGTGSSFAFNATTAAIGGIATGVGAPTTNVLRAFLDDITGTSKTTSIFFHNLPTGAPFVSVSCTEANPGIVDFGCGN